MATPEKRGPKPRAGAPTKLVPIRLTDDEHARWRAAAESDVLSLADFVRAAVEERIAKGGTR
jgi:hypothetical protein